MKNKITISILIIAAILSASIFTIRNHEVSIAAFILILLVNILAVLITGYRILKTVNNYFEV